MGASLLYVIGLAALIVLSAFFSGSETALIGSGRVKLNHMARQGSRGAKRALGLLEHPSELLATILVGNNLVNVMAAAIATALMGPLYATLVITLLLLVFAEITPKTLAASQPERIACWIAWPVRLFGLLFLPVVWVTTSLTDVLLWPFRGRRRGQQRRLSRQELLTAIHLGARDGELEPSETRMTHEVLALKDTPVSRIMLPLDEVDAVPETASLEDLFRELARSGNTRYPVYRQEPAEMVGLLIVKDLLVYREGMEENWRAYVRPLMRCQADLEADELLRDMQLQRSHMAAVEDADGRAIGIVTMEDVLEEIVGEIQDEYDDEVELVREIRPGRYFARGDVEVDDLCKVINVDLGPIAEHITLAEWFSKRASPGGSGRLKAGAARVLQRGASRFEILVKGQLAQSRTEGAD
ncbi:MAG: HlyC/CorC family transporter [Deltaproteobacteria bacterium]|nr:HlyC/CorC family transporter [Deltaproteobacteria bacterium]